MTKWNEVTQRWEDEAMDMQNLADPTPEPAPSPYQQPPNVEQASSLVHAPSGTNDEPKHEETVEENATMIWELFAKILNKAVNATELAKRVAELEEACQRARREVEELRSELALEEAAHEETQRDLQNVQGTLTQRDSAIHDLVMERDIVVGERNAAQEQRDGAIQSVAYLEMQLSQVHKELEQERQRNHTLEERSNLMAHRVNALKEAFGALHTI